MRCSFCLNKIVDICVGEKESRIVMARTLARLEHMPESSRSLASSRESIKTLTNMMNSEDEEVVDAAILALKNLSITPTVGILIADCTGLEVPFTRF